MDFKLLAFFVTLTILNVVVSTIKSLVTLKGGKGAAACVNAIAYGFNTIVTVYTMCDLPLFSKVGVVAVCNLIGVYVVKYAEEKGRKDKLWKVEMTVNAEQKEKLKTQLKDLDIPFNYIDGVGKYTIFNCYCATQKESALVREVGSMGGAKFFVSETKKIF